MSENICCIHLITNNLLAASFETQFLISGELSRLWRNEE